MLIDANTFSTIAAGAVPVSVNAVRGVNVDSARKKFTLFTAMKRETEWSEKHGFTFNLEPTEPADKPQEIPDYGTMKAAARMGIPYEEYAAILKSQGMKSGATTVGKKSSMQRTERKRELMARMPRRWKETPRG